MTDDAGHCQLVSLRDLTGAMLGEHSVSVRMVAEDRTDEPIPSRYNAAIELRATVARGRNRFDFPLTSGP